MKLSDYEPLLPQLTIDHELVFVGTSQTLEKIYEAKFNKTPESKANYRANAAWVAGQSWKSVPKTKAHCVRCFALFAARKGTKFCSDNCRKRHHEASPKGVQQ